MNLIEAMQRSKETGERFSRASGRDRECDVSVMVPRGRIDFSFKLCNQCLLATDWEAVPGTDQRIFMSKVQDPTDWEPVQDAETPPSTALEALERYRQRYGMPRAPALQKAIEDNVQPDVVIEDRLANWQPMTAMNKRAVPFASLPLSVQRQIREKFSDCPESTLQAYLWEDINS